MSTAIRGAHENNREALRHPDSTGHIVDKTAITNGNLGNFGESERYGEVSEQ